MTGPAAEHRRSAIWKQNEPNGVVVPDVKSISLFITAESTERARAAIGYEFTNFEACGAETKGQKASAFK